MKRVIPAAGERLEVLVRWTQGGQARTAAIEEWLYDKNRHGPSSRIEWVFAGSVPTEDGQVLADYDGTVLTVVDFDGPIIAVAGSHSSSNAELWLSANTEQIPPVGTRVTLIVQGARPRVVFGVDRFGRLSRDGQPSRLQQWIQAAGEAGGSATGILQYDPALPDIQVEQLLTALRQAGLRETVAEPLAATAAAGPATQRTEVEEQGLAILQTLADVSRQLALGHGRVGAIGAQSLPQVERAGRRRARRGWGGAGLWRARGGEPGESGEVVISRAGWRGAPDVPPVPSLTDHRLPPVGAPAALARARLQTPQE